MTLRSMRLERGLPQREVAEHMGIQRPAVSKMERKAAQMQHTPCALLRYV